MKKNLIALLLLSVIITGCQSSTTLTAKQITDRYQVSEALLKNNLNALDNSQDALEQYQFKHYKKNLNIELLSKEFSKPLKADIAFDYAIKDATVVLCFPPEITFSNDDAIKTTVLDEWSYKLTENKLYLTARISVESKKSSETKRTVETVALTINDLE